MENWFCKTGFGKLDVALLIIMKVLTNFVRLLCEMSKVNWGESGKVEFTVYISRPLKKSDANFDVRAEKGSNLAVWLKWG